MNIILNIITTLIGGYIFGMITESIIFLIYIALIRTYAGGYHSNNPFICYCISIVLLVSALYALKYKIWNLNISVVITFLSVIIFWLYAPTEHYNKPLDDVEKHVYKNRLLNILVILIAGIVLFFLLKLESWALSGCFALLASALLIIKARFLEGVSFRRVLFGVNKYYEIK